MSGNAASIILNSLRGVSCRSCNTSKCSDEVTAWLRRKHLDERAFLVRPAQIVADLELHPVTS